MLKLRKTQKLDLRMQLIDALRGLAKGKGTELAAGSVVGSIRPQGPAADQGGTALVQDPAVIEDTVEGRCIQALSQKMGPQAPAAAPALRPLSQERQHFAVHKD